jgi:2-(1,2-epoxy-1,2-dihydrophenyl)acetyl-CoA isomerase
MGYETILLSVEDGVATIAMNRPQVMNGLNAQMRIELSHAFRHAPEKVRVIVLTGAERAFCSGQDLGDGGNAAGLDIERTLRDEY